MAEKWAMCTVFSVQIIINQGMKFELKQLVKMPKCIFFVRKATEPFSIFLLYWEYVWRLLTTCMRFSTQTNYQVLKYANSSSTNFKFLKSNKTMASFRSIQSVKKTRNVWKLRKSAFYIAWVILKSQPTNSSEWFLTILWENEPATFVLFESFKWYFALFTSNVRMLQRGRILRCGFCMA